VLADAEGGDPQVVLLSSGSEVALIITAREKLVEHGVRTRVVSMPSMEIFARQSAEYQASVLPKGVPRVSIEAAATMPWYRWIGPDGVVLGIDRYGASAPYEKVYDELGVTVDKVVEAAKMVIAEKSV
jgi:transketolase